MHYIQSLIWGIFAALLALLVQLLATIVWQIFFPTSTITTSLMHNYTLPAFLLFAAFVEESSKYIFITRRIHSLLSFGYAGMLHALFVGAGFALVEIAFFASSNDVVSSAHALSRLLLIHLLTASVSGFFVIAARRKFRALLYAIILTTCAHGIYNLLVLVPAMLAPLTMELFLVTVSAMALTLCGIMPLFRRKRASLAQ